MSQRYLYAVRQLVWYNTTARSFSASAVCNSGHSRWAKIKHDKGKADVRKAHERQDIAQQIARASKDEGPDPTFNARLPGLITSAKRMGMSKAAIETAIARGQGVSASGQALEAVNVEFLFPEFNIAGIMECQTDNKKRLLMNVAHSLKQAGATITNVAFMFTRRGKIVFQKHDTWNDESILDQAIEAGASDVDVGEDEVVLLTEVQDLAMVADAMAKSLNAKVTSQELIWAPNDDTIVKSDTISSEFQAQLDKVFEKLAHFGEDQNVQETYLNIE